MSCVFIFHILKFAVDISGAVRNVLLRFNFIEYLYRGILCDHFLSV